MRSRTTVVFAAIALGAGADALSPAEWRKQSIYQIVTDRFARTDLSTTEKCDAGAGVYCGGAWRGITQKLDYIQGLGATAIWVSPFVKQMDGNTLDGESYHGYWAQDIFKVNPSFGTEADLLALSDALHARGMYLMVDVVTNHMAFRGCRSCVDYSVFNPFSSQSYFHPGCGIDYNSETSIQQCWQGDDIVSLPDLRTEDQDVRDVWNGWIAQMVAKYKIDGLRIDSAKHQETSFWPPFEAAAGVYMAGEVLSGDPSYVIPFQKYMSGLLNYPTFYWITGAFASSSGSIQNLANGINTMKDNALNLSLYGSFLENHDQQRFAYRTKDIALAKNAIAFTILMDGIPIIYQGQEQRYDGGDVPWNREALWFSGYNTESELYRWIAQLNRLRSRAIQQDTGYLGYKMWPIYSDSHVIATRKGFDGHQVIGVYSNFGSGNKFRVTLSPTVTGFVSGQRLVEVMSCSDTKVNADGNLVVESNNGEPRVYYPFEELSDSGICSAVTSASGSTSTQSISSSSKVNSFWAILLSLLLG